LIVWPIEARPEVFLKRIQRVLNERRFNESRTLVYFSAAADGDLSRLPGFARMLAEHRVDIVVVRTVSARAAMSAAPSTPIVL
jgi:hypothetical protein